MTRKRSQHHPQKKTKEQKKHIIYITVAVIIIVIIAALVLIQDPTHSNDNNTSNSTNDETWLFAMDTRSEYVGGKNEYQTGYIPTLVIIDIDGNIVHKSAGVHTKSELMNLVEDAKESSGGRSKAPNFTLETLYGNQFTLSDYRGIPVILDLMAVRCPPCEQQMPELQKLKKALGSEIVILSIDVDGASGSEKPQDVINAFAEYIKEE